MRSTHSRRLHGKGFFGRIRFLKQQGNGRGNITGVRNWKGWWAVKWDLMKTKWSNLWHIDDWTAHPGPVLNLTLTPFQRSSHFSKTKKLFMSLSGGWEEEEGNLPCLSKKYYRIAFPSILLSGLIRVLKITVVSWTFIPLPQNTLSNIMKLFMMVYDVTSEKFQSLDSQNGRKYLQTMYVIKDLYLEYIKNFTTLQWKDI